MAKTKRDASATPATGDAGTGAIGIDPDASYAVRVSERLSFAGAKLAPGWSTEVRGEYLTRLLASEHRDKVVGWAPA
jgi:hypothetical protein